MTSPRDSWLTIVLASDQTPRFRAICYSCGASGLHPPMWLRILTERGCPRLGNHFVLVPRCSRCGWRRRIGGVMIAVLIAVIGAWAIDHPRGSGSVRPWDAERIVRTMIGVSVIAMIFGSLAWLLCAHVDVVEREDGLHFSFRRRRVAEAFVQDNASLLPGTSRELLPPVPPPNQ